LLKLPQGLDPTKVRRMIKAIVICEDEDTWEETEKDINELINMLCNIKRQVKIIEVEVIE